MSFLLISAGPSDRVNIPVHSCNTTFHVPCRRLPLSASLSQLHDAPVPLGAHLQNNTNTFSRLLGRPKSQLSVIAEAWIAYDGSVIHSSAFLTCTTLCSRFATVLSISFDSQQSDRADLDLVPHDPAPETDQIVRTITPFVVVFFTACGTLLVSIISMNMI